MALEQEGDCHIVEGYVVDHSLLLKSRSVGYLSEIGAGEAAFSTTATTATTRPPKISVTLSEYLSAASPNPDPSCDFGWFTPTASASSLAPAAGDALDGGYFAAPSPSSHHPSSFLFTSASIESSTKTLAISPESDAFGSGGGVDESLQCSCTTVQAQAQAGAANNSSGGGGPRQVSFRGNGMISQEPPSSAVPKDQHQRQRGAAPGSTAAAGYAIGSTADDGRRGNSVSEGSMGVRLLPVAHSRSTTAHLNSWHTLYPHVSDTRKLASVLSGGCTLHLRRTSFPISTRHFPEKPLTPRARTLGSGRNSSANSSSSNSSNSSSSSSSNSHRDGTGLKGSNGPPLLQRGSAAGAATSQQQQQQQQDGGRDDSSEARSGGGGGGPKKRQQQQSCSWAITEIRVVQPPVGAPFAQYLVVVCMGREKLVAGWRRASDFEQLARTARRAWMSKVRVCFRSIEYVDSVLEVGVRSNRTCVHREPLAQEAPTWSVFLFLGRQIRPSVTLVAREKAVLGCALLLRPERPSFVIPVSGLGSDRGAKEERHQNHEQSRERTEEERRRYSNDVLMPTRTVYPPERRCVRCLLLFSSACLKL